MSDMGNIFKCSNSNILHDADMWGYVSENSYMLGLTDVELLFYNRT